MTFDDETLKQIEELAGCFLDPEEISILLGIDGEALMQQVRNKSGQAYIAYFKGKTLVKKEVQQNIVKMARHGSPQAEELVSQMIIKQSIAEKRGKR